MTETRLNAMKARFILTNVLPSGSQSPYVSYAFSPLLMFPPLLPTRSLY